MFDNKRFKDKILGTHWKITSIFNDTISLVDNHNIEYFVYSSHFLSFLLKYKICVKDNAFVFTMAIDNKNMLSTEHEYNDWLDIIEKDKEANIKYDDLKVGFVYQLDTKDDYFIYLGKKWVIKWQYDSKKHKIILTKPKQKHICVTTYKTNIFNLGQLYKNISFNLNKQKVIKEIGEYNKNKFTIEQFIENLKITDDCLYFHEDKPKNNLDLCFKEVDLKYLIELERISKANFMNLFHKSSNFYIKNRYSIYEKATNDSDDSFHRRISISEHNDVIFYEPFENELKGFIENKKSYDYDIKLKDLTKPCEDNDHFRIAPKNYYILTLN